MFFSPDSMPWYVWRLEKVALFLNLIRQKSNIPDRLFSFHYLSFPVNPGLLCLPEIVNKIVIKALPCDKFEKFLDDFQWIFSPFNTLCWSRDLLMIAETKWTVNFRVKIFFMMTLLQIHIFLPFVVGKFPREMQAYVINQQTF